MKTMIAVAIAIALPVAWAAGWLAWLAGDTFMELQPPSCSEMLPEGQVRAIVAAHPDMVGRINAAGAMAVGVVAMEEGPCRGRAYLLIGYDTGATKNRTQADREELLRGAGPLAELVREGSLTVSAPAC